VSGLNASNRGGQKGKKQEQKFALLFRQASLALRWKALSLSLSFLPRTTNKKAHALVPGETKGAFIPGGSQEQPRQFPDPLLSIKRVREESAGREGPGLTLGRARKNCLFVAAAGAGGCGGEEEAGGVGHAGIVVVDTFCRRG